MVAKSGTSFQGLGRDHDHLSVLLATGFWPGHLYPIISLGEELVSRGHNVTLCATVMEGSDLLPALPETYGIKFVSAGFDNLTQKDYDEAIKGLHDYNRSAMSVYMAAPSWTAFKVRAKVSEIVSGFDILISDLSVLPVGVYNAKLGVKSVIISPVIPYVRATLPEWPAPVGGSGQTDDVSFLERLGNPTFLLHSLMVKTAFGNTVSIDEEFGRVTRVQDFYDYPGTHMPLLSNTVFGFDFPKTRSPLTHYVGPLLMTSTPPLEKSLQEWLSTKQDKAVVYIGMGSTGLMSKDYVQAFVDGVLATTFDAVWTLSDDDQVFLEDVTIDPKRFYVSKWIPRQTLFKHPALGMSLVHCGLNGVQESLYNGLPVICAPHFFDHFEVAARIYAASVGIPLYWLMDSLLGSSKITAELVTSVLRTISENKTYSEQAKKMQKIYSFAGGARRAADLVEFYAEVGYDHLIPAYAKYEWSCVQYYNLDVYCVLLLLSFLVLYSAFRLLKCCCCRVCCSSKKPKQD